MRTKASGLWMATLVSAAIALGGCSAPSNGNSEAAKSEGSGGLLSRIIEKRVTVPAGTVIPVVLDQAVSSKGNRSGDTFDATVVEAVVVDGKTVIPKNTRARGRVVDAQESGRLQTPARLSLALTAVQLGGDWRDIDTRSITFRGKSHKKRDIEMIGGGAALGAIIGGVAAGGKGAAIGAAAGAGAGTAGAAATGKKDIALPVESHLTFRLTRPLTVQVKG